MERPILNPSVFDDPDRRPLDPAEVQRPQVARWVWHTLCSGAQMLRGLWKLLWTPLFPVRVQPEPAERKSLLARSAAPVIFRLMFLGLLTLATVILLVYLMTHPPSGFIPGAPITGAVHAERHSIRSADGVTLDAYLVPALDAKRVLMNGEVAVRAKWPAVLLVPGQQSDAHELDKLIGSLHDQGYVVALLRLRGVGNGECAQTFGLLEKQDVAAAITWIRSFTYVDTPRVSIIATGTGANAAMLARRDDPTIDHVVVHHPLDSFDSVVARAVSAPWLRPACRWAFEVIHQVDAEEMNRDALLGELKENVLLLANHPARTAQRQMIVRYLQTDPQVISAAR